MVESYGIKASPAVPLGCTWGQDCWPDSAGGVAGLWFDSAGWVLVLAWPDSANFAGAGGGCWIGTRETPPVGFWFLPNSTAVLLHLLCPGAAHLPRQCQEGHGLATPTPSSAQLGGTGCTPSCPAQPRTTPRNPAQPVLPRPGPAGGASPRGDGQSPRIHPQWWDRLGQPRPVEPYLPTIGR